MDLSVISFAADAASGCAGAGPGVMIVPAPCALLYAGSGGFMLDLYVSAKKGNPSANCLSLGLWYCHDEGGG